MTSQANSNARLVRCPKCRHVLRELVEVPVYKCGGCGAILQAKQRNKDPEDTKSQVHEADPKHKNECENTSEKHITDESLKDEIPKRVDSGPEDRMGVGDSSPAARTRMEEEEGKLLLDQYNTADSTCRDDDKESEKSPSNEILASCELNHHESNSLVLQSHNYESESLSSSASLNKETQSRLSSLKYNFDGDKEVSENDLENATDNPLAGKETESQRFSEDNCDGGKTKFENELQNTSDKPSSGNSDLEKVFGSISEDRMESLGGTNQPYQFFGSDTISCHVHEGSSPQARTRMKDEEGKLPLYQDVTTDHNTYRDDDKESEKSAGSEILSSSELNYHGTNSLVPQSRYHESELFLLSLEKETESQHSSSKYYLDRGKEASENDLENDSEIDKESEKSPSNEILASCELNHHESKSLVLQSHNYESESLSSSTSLEKETQSRYSSLKYNFDGDKEVSENDLENATDNPLAGKETESQRLSEDNCDGGKRKFENELQNASDKPSSGNSDLEKVFESISEDRMESLGGTNQTSQFFGSDTISCHDHECSSPQARTCMKDEEGKLPLYQDVTTDHNTYRDDDKETGKSAANEILSSSELNYHGTNSLVPQSRYYESELFLLSLEKETQSQHYSSKYYLGGEKEASENDLENDSENTSAEKETESQRSSEDNCDGGKKQSETEVQNTSEIFSTGNSDLAHTEADIYEPSFDQSGTEVHNKSRNDKKEQSGDVSISNKVLSSPKLNYLENDSSAPGYHMYESDESLLSLPKKVTERESGYSSPTNNDKGEDEDSSQVDGVKREVDEKRKSPSILKRTNAEIFLNTVTKDQITTADNHSTEGVLLDKLMSPQRESMHQVESGMVPGFRSVSSDDTLENMPYFYDKGDLGVTLRSSTARNYYASDGSASGNEIDNHLPDRRFQLLKKSLKDVGPNNKKVPERSEFKMNHVTCNESELQRESMNSGSFSQEKKHSTTKVSRWHQDELLEHTRYRYPVRNTMRNETDEYHSRLLFSNYDFHSSKADQGNSSSSHYGQNNFSALPDNPHELHRLELLRMVYELQDQLKRTQISEGMPHGRFFNRPSKGKEHQFSENRKNYSDLAYHNYHGKYSRDRTWLKDKELSQIVLPEDPTHFMHRVDCSCLRCCSQKQLQQHHLEQLPPHDIYYSEQQSMANARRSHHSASSPQHYATSEFSLWSRDMKSDDQWHNKHKEAQIPIANRYFQPIAGGAPIVACYHCSEMLQLPAESLLFKRRCHQLRCGACSEVLKFSLQNKIHMVRYDLIIPTTPPPSENANNTQRLAESASSSDHSQLFSRSYSTGDNFSASPRKMSSASSFKTRKEGVKSKSIRESVNKNKNSVESFKSAGSSSEMPDTEHSYSESEVDSPHPGSALHKLMGYSSVRRLVYE